MRHCSENLSLFIVLQYYLEIHFVI